MFGASGLLLLMLLLNASCCCPDSYKMHAAAEGKAHVRYCGDADYRRKIDSDWRRANDSLVKGGFQPVPHPFRPETMRAFGIAPVPGVTPEGG